MVEGRLSMGELKLVPKEMWVICGCKKTKNCNEGLSNSVK